MIYRFIDKIPFAKYVQRHLGITKEQRILTHEEQILGMMRDQYADIAIEFRFLNNIINFSPIIAVKPCCRRWQIESVFVEFKIYWGVQKVGDSRFEAKEEQTLLASTTGNLLLHCEEDRKIECAIYILSENHRLKNIIQIFLNRSTIFVILASSLRSKAKQVTRHSAMFVHFLQQSLDVHVTRYSYSPRCDLSYVSG